MPAPKIFKSSGNPFKKKTLEQKDEKSLEDYQIISELGRGGFAVVHRVHQKGQAEGHDVAMRIVSLKHVLTGPTVYTVADLRKKFEGVGKLMDSIKSKHILKFMDYKITKDDLITFSEYCRGGDLFDYIINSPDGHLKEEDAKLAVYALCEALAEVHSIGCIHRDIKPENVFVRRPDSTPDDIVLGDFGCAIGDTTPTALHRGVAGSAGYLAPEMIRGEPYNMLVDEWSLGITVYEILSGRSPMLSTTSEDLDRETLEREIPYPARYWRVHSHEAKDFTRRLLQKDPKQRMSVEEALRHPWLTGHKIQREGSTSSTSSEASTGTGPDPSAPLQNRKTIQTTRRKSINRGGDDIVTSLAMGGGGGQIGQMKQFDTKQVLACQCDRQSMQTLQSVDSGSTVDSPGPMTPKDSD